MADEKEDGTGLSLAMLQEVQAEVFRHEELSEERFVDVFAKFTRLTPTQLQKWFRRIDANANGTVDWDEFSQYILLHSHSERSRQELYEDWEAYEVPPQHRGTPQDARTAHASAVSSCQVHTNRSGAVRIFTGSVDSTVRVWNGKTLAHEETLNLPAAVLDSALACSGRRLISTHLDRSISVVDTEKLEVIGLFASRDSGRAKLGRETMTVSSGARGISRSFLESLAERGEDGEDPVKVFEMEREKALRMSTALEPNLMRLDGIKDVPHALSIVALNDENSFSGMMAGGGELGQEERDLMIVGLKCGDLLGYTFSAEHMQHRQHEMQSDYDQYALRPIFKVKKPHSACITKIQYAEAIGEIITTSWDGTIKFLNTETGRPSRTLHHALDSTAGADPTPCAVFGLDWSCASKLLGTHGTEHEAYLWYPYVANPIARLPHPSPVRDIAFHPNGMHLATLCDDKLLKFWDVRMFRCVQATRHDSHSRRVTKLHYSTALDSLITASTHPGVLAQQHSEAPPRGGDAGGGPAAWEGRDSEEHLVGKQHRFPVMGVLLPKELEGYVITVDGDTVITWNVATGTAVFCFSLFEKIRRTDFSTSFTSYTSQSLLPLDQMEQMAVRSVALDENGRRLLTGMRNGFVFVWNYVNGQLLRMCVSPDAGVGCIRGTRHSVHDHAAMDSSALEVSNTLHCADRAGNYRYICGTIGDRLFVWDDSEAANARHWSQVLFEWTLPDSKPHEVITCLAFQPPARLAIGTSDGRVLVHNVKTKSTSLSIYRGAPPEEMEGARGSAEDARGPRTERSMSEEGLKGYTSSPALQQCRQGDADDESDQDASKVVTKVMWVSTASASLDQHLLYAVYQDTVMQVVDMEHKTVVHQWLKLRKKTYGRRRPATQTPESYEVTAVASGEPVDPRTLISADSDGDVRIWRLQDEESVERISKFTPARPHLAAPRPDGDSATPPPTTPHVVTSVACLKHFIVCGARDGAVTLHHLNGRQVGVFGLPQVGRRGTKTLPAGRRGSVRRRASRRGTASEVEAPQPSRFSWDLRRYISRQSGGLDDTPALPPRKDPRRVSLAPGLAMREEAAPDDASVLLSPLQTSFTPLEGCGQCIPLPAAADAADPLPPGSFTSRPARTPKALDSTRIPKLPGDAVSTMSARSAVSPAPMTAPSRSPARSRSSTRREASPLAPHPPMVPGSTVQVGSMVAGSQGDAVLALSSVVNPLLTKGQTVVMEGLDSNAAKLLSALAKDSGRPGRGDAAAKKSVSPPPQKPPKPSPRHRAPPGTTDGPRDGRDQAKAPRNACSHATMMDGVLTHAQVQPPCDAASPTLVREHPKGRDSAAGERYTSPPYPQRRAHARGAARGLGDPTMGGWGRVDASPMETASLHHNSRPCDIEGLVPLAAQHPAVQRAVQGSQTHRRPGPSLRMASSTARMPERGAGAPVQLSQPCSMFTPDTPHRSGWHAYHLEKVLKAVQAERQPTALPAPPPPQVLCNGRRMRGLAGVSRGSAAN